jgi:hypothetical protein
VTAPHDSPAPHDSEVAEIRLAPAQLADLVAGGVTVLVPGGSSVRLLPDYGTPATSPGAALVDAAVVGCKIGMSAAWVREHGAELGGQRMGDGPRPRWRFDLEQARRAWAARSAGKRPSAPQPLRQNVSRRRRSSASGSAVDLLPVRPQQGGRRAA